MTLSVFEVLPAASSAITVIVLSPVCSGMEAIVHDALRIVPFRRARPVPPRSFDQRTRYSRKLSVATPLRPTTPFGLMSVWPVMLIVGATGSNERQRARCACASSRVSSIGVDSGIAIRSSSFSFSFAPPQPSREKHATACATNRADRFN
jgi:hypothetical protein